MPPVQAHTKAGQLGWVGQRIACSQGRKIKIGLSALEGERIDVEPNNDSRVHSLLHAMMRGGSVNRFEATPPNSIQRASTPSTLSLPNHASAQTAPIQSKLAHEAAAGGTSET